MINLNKNFFSYPSLKAQDFPKKKKFYENLSIFLIERFIGEVLIPQNATNLIEHAKEAIKKKENEN